MPSVEIPCATRSKISSAAGYFDLALSARSRISEVSNNSRQGKIANLPITGVVVR